MVDHTIVLNHLETRFEITEPALKWIDSFFQDCKQTVLINGVNSSEHILDFNVPQGGPCLSPKFVIGYESPLGEIIRSHGLQAHCYADDIQLYLTFSPEDENRSRRKIEKNIQDIHCWIASFKLK